VLLRKMKAVQHLHQHQAAVSMAAMGGPVPAAEAGDMRAAEITSLQLLPTQDQGSSNVWYRNISR